MATFDYTAIAEEARAILAEFGNPLVMNRFTDNANPVTGESNRVLAVSQTLIGAILPASQGTLEAFDVRFLSGDILASKDVRFCIFSAVGSTFVPAPMDEVEFDGSVWQVMGCTPLNVTGSDPVIFSVGFQRP